MLCCDLLWGDKSDGPPRTVHNLARLSPFPKFVFFASFPLSVFFHFVSLLNLSSCLNTTHQCAYVIHSIYYKPLDTVLVLSHVMIKIKCKLRMWGVPNFTVYYHFRVGITEADKILKKHLTKVAIFQTGSLNIYQHVERHLK